MTDQICQFVPNPYRPTICKVCQKSIETHKNGPSAPASSNGFSTSVASKQSAATPPKTPMPSPSNFTQTSAQPSTIKPPPSSTTMVKATLPPPSMTQSNSASIDCLSFQPHCFASEKCSNCFKPKSLHSQASIDAGAAKSPTSAQANAKLAGTTTSTANTSSNGNSPKLSRPHELLIKDCFSVNQTTSEEKIADICQKIGEIIQKDSSPSNSIQKAFTDAKSEHPPFNNNIIQQLMWFLERSSNANTIAKVGFAMRAVCWKNQQGCKLFVDEMYAAEKLMTACAKASTSESSQKLYEVISSICEGDPRGVKLFANPTVQARLFDTFTKYAETGDSVRCFLGCVSLLCKRSPSSLFSTAAFHDILVIAVKRIIAAQSSSTTEEHSVAAFCDVLESLNIAFSDEALKYFATQIFLQQLVDLMQIIHQLNILPKQISVIVAAQSAIKNRLAHINLLSAAAQPASVLGGVSGNSASTPSSSPQMIPTNVMSGGSIGIVQQSLKMKYMMPLGFSPFNVNASFNYNNNNNSPLSSSSSSAASTSYHINNPSQPAASSLTFSNPTSAAAYAISNSNVVGTPGVPASFEQHRLFDRVPTMGVAEALRALFSLHDKYGPPPDRPDLADPKMIPTVDKYDEIVNLVSNMLPRLKQRSAVEKLIKENGITDDDIKVLCVYKLEDPYPVYLLLNGWLTSNMRGDIKDKVGPLFVLLYRAMEKLPIVTDKAARGIKINGIPYLAKVFADHTKQLKKGKMISFWGFASFSTNSDVANSPNFLGAPNEEAIKYQCGELSGVDMEPFSILPKSEYEILPLCPAVFKVESAEPMYKKLIISIEQVDNSPYAFVTPKKK